MKISSHELRELYYEENLSAPQIAERLKVSSATIYRWMNRYDIPRRSRGESLQYRTPRTELTEKQQYILDGLMLGDASIPRVPKKGVNTGFSLTCKYKEFLKHVREILPFRWGSGGKIHEFTTNGGFSNTNSKIYTAYLLWSRFDKKLTEERERWYPYGKKRVPRDIVLAPEALLYWFIGDGTRGKRRKSTRRNDYRYVVNIGTHGFPIEDDLFLISKLDELGITATINRAIKKNFTYLYISKKSHERFYEYIGRLPIDCYDHKFP